MAFERQELAMLMEAHIRAHDFFGGLCERGIYDNPKTIVQEIGPGKQRDYNKRFLQMASHYLFDVCACTPETTTSIERLVILANFFDVSLDWLTGRTDNPDSHKELP